MKKTTTVLSAVSTAIAVTSIIAALAMITILWAPMCRLYTTSEDVMGMGPVIPVSSIVSMLEYVAVSLLLLFTSKVKKVFAAEIIAIALIVLVFPPLIRILGDVQTRLIGQYTGAYALSAYYTTSSIISIPLSFAAISPSLCLVISGMRIADKVNLRRMNSANTEI